MQEQRKTAKATTSEMILEALREQIINGTLGPQEKLVESSLADRYEKTAQLEDASQQLLDADAAMMRKNK